MILLKAEWSLSSKSPWCFVRRDFSPLYAWGPIWNSPCCECGLHPSRRNSALWSKEHDNLFWTNLFYKEAHLYPRVCQKPPSPSTRSISHNLIHRVYNPSRLNSSCVSTPFPSQCFSIASSPSPSRRRRPYHYSPRPTLTGTTSWADMVVRAASPCAASPVDMPCPTPSTAPSTRT